MAGGLFFQVRRNQYFIGLSYPTVAALTSAIGSAVLNGDEIYEGISQGRMGRIASGALVLTIA